jgi:DNA polymerase I
MPETLYAIDVFSLVYQVFHAIPPMTSPSGQPTNAVFGFSRDLIGLLRSKKPDYLVCALDLPGEAVRDSIYAEYKSNRAEMPDDLKPQIAVVKELIEAFGIPAIGVPGWEADDVLATLARLGQERGIEVNIVTSDKDARQLLSPTVRLYNVRKDKYFDEAALLETWDIRPDQVVDFQSLVGDKIDNVPGIPGVGPKKASALLNQFGTLEDVLARADEAPGKKLAESLKEFAELARVSRQLVELNQFLDLDFEWDRARPGRMDVPRLSSLFRDCGFRRMIDDVRTVAPEAVSEPAALFADGEPVVSIITDEASLDDVLTKVEAAGTVAVRVESSGLNPITADIVAITLTVDDCTAAFIPMSELVTEKTLARETVIEKLRSLFESGKVSLSGHDLKASVLALRRAGLRVDHLGLDTMVGCYLIHAGSRSHGLAQLVERYFDGQLVPLTEAAEADDDARSGTNTEAKSKPKSGGSTLPLKELAQHSAEEACLMRRVGTAMHQELESQELWKLYDEVERPLISVLAQLEHTGIRVDAEELGRQNEDVSARIATLVTEIHEIAGEEFNIDSPKQLAVILFEKLGLPVIRKTKTGASTDQEVLEKLAAEHEHALPGKIIEHRQLVKLKGTYLDALPKLINPETGRIHASFNQVVAATGRLSSSNPNLQNIPIRTADGERIRRAFVPGEPGWKLICADYSQIELRMLAHFSRDVAMQHAFSLGIDIHRAVAAEVFGVPAEEVDSAQRRIAKAVNFGVIYGQSSFGLSNALGITREEAAAFIENYFVRYSGVAEFLEETLDLTRSTGFAKTILGRRRAISGIRPKRTGQLNMPERTAVNTVIQGSAADMIKVAMIKIQQRLDRENHPGRMLLQIHDELVFEVPASQAEALQDLVKTEMEAAMPLEVPVTVDIATGDHWLEAKG